MPSYAHHGGYRFVVVGADGVKDPSATFPTKARAAAARAEVQRTLDGRTDVDVSTALVEYEAYLHSDEDGGAGRKDAIYQTMRKLRTFYTDGEELLEALTTARFKALYTDLRTRPTDKTKDTKTPKPYSANYHRLALAEAKTFLRWCYGREYLPEAIVKGAETVKGWGRMRKRKRQPTIDEVRLFLAKAHHLAGVKGQQGAVAALMCLTMGLRAGEVVARVAREVDDNGTRLLVGERLVADGASDDWAPKTVDSEGYMDIPEELQPYLVDLKAAAKDGYASIWTRKHTRNWPRAWVRRICKGAGIPVYTAHDMRRAAGTASLLGGLREAQQRAVANLRHSDWAVTGGGSYVAKTAIGRVAQRSALKVWRGGVK